MLDRTDQKPPVLAVENLKKHYVLGSSWLSGETKTVFALDGVSLSIASHETLSIVGESGSGKTTLGKVVMGLIPATAGQVHLDGRRIDNLSAAQLRPLRRDMQLIFQDPFSSLNPRMKVRDIIGEPIVNFGLASNKSELRALTAQLLEKVRLPAEAADRYPHEFSGGQRQRIAIARALAPGARFIVCDEAVSALDVSVKAQIINLLQELQNDLGLTLLFISHDLAIVEHLTHRVGVMYLGKIVEIADRRSLFRAPQHPYTRALLSAVPVPDPQRRTTRIALKGDIPNPMNPPSGCRFRTRCPLAFERCQHEEPILRPRGSDGHLSACHLDELPVATASVHDHRKTGIRYATI
ncbi:ABC transporter ATP-binding protein [Rhizobium puerariae]|uniref:ABC transporter ATP-binding protein n=1 Tax=Rhizobium puerariae TaxID=1585791 RepID=A0ABV6AMV2_9HYPH